MFKTIFGKKAKEVRKEDLRMREHFPNRDWAVLLAFFLLLILASSIISALTFFKVVNEDVSVGKVSEEAEADKSINIPQLQEAAAFIRSRTGE